ncbi:toxin-antitoxin system YwqK family antitoxin [Bordetella hinzii]|uniref:MORN repeat protein n=1 Tax=Bordetella hinzii OH87 BAL007II TaxID=1331262 RepID=A0ABR4QVX9_9BORD|nr:toxin-antitoxin system YwqK family antitoxin [Bordetella hinzii]KCB21770.1 MORN repeat protein [Bordetella hinzii OH87 BAL007II]KCB30048.1 MORN repeat protein [Bordetella hinzii CA90 BAL1384]KCB39764.1 MORN repeat protein [Bordetella hinzii 5132]
MQWLERVQADGEVDGLAPQEKVEAMLANGRLHGLLRLSENGQPLYEAQYVDGRLDGECRQYEQGRLVVLRHYVAGQLHGVCETFDAGGQLSSRTVYVNGRLEGPGQWFHEGVLLREGAFHRGLPQGDWRHYGPDGLIESMPYVSGRPHGVARRYGPDGQLLSERIYRDGRAEQPWTSLPAPPPAEPPSRLERWVRGGK